MANRKITQFPPILGADIVSGDLFTLVAVNEVNPTLKNKKITSAQFISGYLNQYFLPLTGSPSFAGDVTVTGNLTVLGDTTISGLLVQGTTVFEDDVTISGNLVTTGLVSGFTLSGDTVRAREGDFVDVDITNLLRVGTAVDPATAQVSGGLTATFITGVTNINGLTQIESPVGLLDTVTGVTATFTTSISGTSITGNLIQGTSGEFQHLNALEFSGNTVIINGSGIISGDLVISGDLNVSGDVNANDFTATGTISGAFITGDTAQFTTITAQTGIFTSTLSGNTITGETLDIAGSGLIESGQRIATHKFAENEAIVFAIALG